MSGKTTLVMGASPKPTRYAHLAVRRLLSSGHPVIAVGRHTGSIGEEVILPDIPEGRTVHTVTMYLNMDHQRDWEDGILALRPERIIFNPGAENPRLAAKARARGIEALDACTLVMIATGQY